MAANDDRRNNESDLVCEPGIDDRSGDLGPALDQDRLNITLHQFVDNTSKISSSALDRYNLDPFFREGKNVNRIDVICENKGWGFAGRCRQGRIEWKPESIIQDDP